MALTIAETGTDYTPPEAGTFTARCCALLDMGTQTSVWEGEEKRAHKVLLSFEITDPDTRRADGTAHVISKKFSGSLHAKSGLRKFLESWRGRPFTPEELRGFDLKNVLGLDCLVGVVHESKGDRVFANLGSVMKLPRGMAPGTSEIEPVAFDLSAPDWQVFAGLGSRLQAQIAGSPEYMALPNKPRTIAVGTPARVDAYWVFDAMATYTVNKNLDLQLNAYNLADKTYVAAINKSGFRYTPSQPRSFSLTANIKF